MITANNLSYVIQPFISLLFERYFFFWWVEDLQFFLRVTILNKKKTFGHSALLSSPYFLFSIKKKKNGNIWSTINIFASLNS